MGSLFSDLQTRKQFLKTVYQTSPKLNANGLFIFFFLRPMCLEHLQQLFLFYLYMCTIQQLSIYFSDTFSSSTLYFFSIFIKIIIFTLFLLLRFSPSYTFSLPLGRDWHGSTTSRPRSTRLHHLQAETHALEIVF